MFKHLFASPPPLVTSSLVIAEAYGWFLRRYDGFRAAQFLAFIEALSPLVVLGFDASELLKTRRILSRFSDQALTLADAHGLQIMADGKHAICWSTDRHLALTGVSIAINISFN